MYDPALCCAQLYESNIWINEGRNFSSSVIHYDMNHQMMYHALPFLSDMFLSPKVHSLSELCVGRCVYAGKKEWILWDSAKYADKMPMWSDYLQTSNGKIIPPQGSDDSPIDPEKVDLDEFPQFAEV